MDTVTKGEMTAGMHRVPWTLGKDNPSGMYFYKVVAGHQQATGKLTLVD